VFITGASSGIGLATAKLLLSQGYNVAIFSLTPPEPKDAEILRHIHSALVLRGDITKEMQIKKALQKTVQKFGSLDVLINNAGISQKKLFADSSPKEWEIIININLKGTLLTTKCALPYMRKGGLVINISSGSALHPVPHLSLYSLTKAAILNFTQTLDAELQPRGIRAITITPGSTQTALFEKASPGKNPLYQPEDIAVVIADTISGKKKPDKYRVVNPFKHLYK
jgi:NAD(P)-dependent dehydrogenase (short-subunit alcohol dehydrogenase family)